MKSVLTVAEMQEKLGISRAKAYQLCHTEGFPVMRIGKKILIPARRFELWVDSCNGSMEG